MRPWALLLALAACAPPPPPAAPPAPTAPTLPPTYGVSFVYEPSLSLLLLRDGQPYDGPATLNGTPPGDDQATMFTADLLFAAGKAPVPDDLLPYLGALPRLTLVASYREIPLPTSGQTNPFLCAQSIADLGKIDPTTGLIPAADNPLDHCDTLGKKAWHQVRDGQQERFDAAWSSVDESTRRRLAAIDTVMIPAVCQRLVASLGPAPPTEQGLRLMPRCQGAFAAEDRARLSDAYARQELPAEMEKARAGDSQAMRRFYQRYSALEPRKADEIRLLAARRFGPKDLKRWLALRDSIERLSDSQIKVSLCDVDEHSIEVAINSVSPRYTQAPAAPRGSLLGFAPGQVPMEMMPHNYRRRDRLAENRPRISRAVAAQTRKQVSVVWSCTRGLHWYLATPLPQDTAG